LTAPARLAALEQNLACTSPVFEDRFGNCSEQVRVTPQRTKELETMFQMVGEAEDIVTNPHRSWMIRALAARGMESETVADAKITN
jgi:hypothetical protein